MSPLSDQLDFGFEKDSKFFQNFFPRSVHKLPYVGRAGLFLIDDEIGVPL